MSRLFANPSKKLKTYLYKFLNPPAYFTAASATSSVRCIENAKLAGGDAVEGGGGLDEEAAIGFSSDKAGAQAFGVADFEKESS